MAPTPLKIIHCIATPTAALVYFSQPLGNPVPPASSGSFVVRRANPGMPQTVNVTSAVFDTAANTATLQLAKAAALKVGDLISIQGTGIVLANGSATGTDVIFIKVNGEESQSEANARRTTEAVEDSVSYPLMTEQVGNPPSSSYGGGTGTGGIGVGGSGSLPLSQLATQAITNVLGWKPKDDDAKGFVGALTQSFSLQDVEGHVEATWTPRTYAVQTDLAGGISGAQASLYTRANEGLQKSLPLLDGLYALNPDSDVEMVTALKDIVSSQFTELVNELGYPGGPRISRVNQYFFLLLGNTLPNTSTTGYPVACDPDKIKGTLGKLRDELQLQSFSHYVNTIEDEQDITNYRILSDYLTSLAQSWVNNVGFFGLDTKKAFLGTQLVLLSRQLSVIGETVGEVRFALDSVFIGPSERQTLQLEFGKGEPAMFIEDILSWTEAFAKDEGPQLIQNAGKLGVGDGFIPVVAKLETIVGEARHPQNVDDLPRGYRTIRVKHALKDLQDQLGELARIAGEVSLQTPPKVFDYDEIVNKIHEEINKAVPKAGPVRQRA
jgi:hypothetical protein